MISNIIKSQDNLNYYFTTQGINEKTLHFFREQIIIDNSKNGNSIPSFKLQNTDNSKQTYLPINYQDINGFNFDTNFFFLKKLERSATITYVFDSPFEMLYYYQIHHSKINSNHQFICFLNTITIKEIKAIIDLIKQTKIHTVFNKNNTIGNINDIRFALVNKNIPFEIYQSGNSIEIINNHQRYLLKKDQILLHKFEKLSKTRYAIKTIKPPKKFNYFKDIICHEKELY